MLIVFVMNDIVMLNHHYNIYIYMVYRNATLQVETLEKLCNELIADDKYFLLNGVSYVTLVSSSWQLLSTSKHFLFVSKIKALNKS